MILILIILLNCSIVELLPCYLIKILKTYSKLSKLLNYLNFSTSKPLYSQLSSSSSPVTASSIAAIASSPVSKTASSVVAFMIALAACDNVWI